MELGIAGSSSLSGELLEVGFQLNNKACLLQKASWTLDQSVHALATVALTSTAVLSVHFPRPGGTLVSIKLCSFHSGHAFSKLM